ncbi:MAG: DedA family protein [Micromonosporaceae bacterium]|nr:DedA family protein [Micromonosporaceae bacterium]
MHWLSQFPVGVIYVVAVLLVAGETATLLGLVLPGEITLILVGFLCYEGILRLSVAVPVMLAAGLVGDSLGFAQGRRDGPRLRDGRLGLWVGPRRWARAERMFLRYGRRAVFFARFLGFARTLVPRLVGMAGMRYRYFLPIDAFGVLGCVGGTLTVGYLAGRSYATVADRFGQASSAVLMLLGVIVAVILIGRYLGRHPDPVAAFGARLAAWRPLRVAARAYEAGFHALTRRLGVGGAVAVNVVTGVLVLFGIGYGLASVVGPLVRHSGLPLVDPLVSRWLVHRQQPSTLHAARVTLSVLRGKYLILLVGLVALALNWRSRVWRADLLGVLGTVGAFIPLVLISLATNWAGPASTGPVPGFFPNQTAVVCASLGMLAWLLGRRFGWAAGAAAWTGAAGGAILVGAARMYLGWSWPSQTIAAMLLGGLWVLVFVVAWHTRDRIRSDQSPVSASASSQVSPHVSSPISSPR